MNKNLTIRCSADDVQRWKDRAVSDGRSLNNWIIRTLNAHQTVVMFEPTVSEKPQISSRTVSTANLEADPTKPTLPTSPVPLVIPCPTVFKVGSGGFGMLLGNGMQVKFKTADDQAVPEVFRAGVKAQIKKLGAK